MNLYVIYDKLAEESGPVFEAKNDKVAYRQFMNSMPDNVDQTDYDLLHIGEIDHSTNKITSVSEKNITDQLTLDIGGKDE